MSFQSRLKECGGLYVVTANYEGRTHMDMVLSALEGGARIIQYREKNGSSREMLQAACSIRELTLAAGALLIINDRVDIAIASRADGVHLGQEDMPYRSAREMLGSGYIIGISATTYDEAVAAGAAGADYIGLGPIYPTASKNDAAPAVGVETLAAVVKTVDVPVVAIGGLSVDNIEGVIKAGAGGVAVISAIAAAGDMAAATQRLNSLIERYKTEHRI